MMNVTEALINIEDRKLSGTLFTPENAQAVGRPAVLLAHGYKSNQSGYAEYAEAVVTEIGATCLTFDLGGHGNSEGDAEGLTINNHMAEMRGAYDYLTAQEGVVSDRIGVVGASLAGYLALRLTVDRNVKQLLMRAPAIFPDGMDNVPRRQYLTSEINNFRRSMNPPPPNHALHTMNRFEGQTTIVRSGFDESIPSSVITAYLRAGQDVTHLTIGTAKHSLDEKQRGVFKQIVVEWASPL